MQDFVKNSTKNSRCNKMPQFYIPFDPYNKVITNLYLELDLEWIEGFNL
ncbi:hypothetical protein Hanom_Chr01g00018681 [Helianthus anomalus]